METMVRYWHWSNYVKMFEPATIHSVRYWIKKKFGDKNTFKYPKADYVGNGRYVFNLKGNDYRMIVLTAFVGQTLFIRWIIVVKAESLLA